MLWLLRAEFMYLLGMSFSSNAGLPPIYLHLHSYHHRAYILFFTIIIIIIPLS